MTTLPAEAVTAAALHRELRKEGFAIVRNVASPGLITRIDDDLAEDFRTTRPSEGHFYGAATTRFGRILARSRAAQELLAQPLLLALPRLLLEWHQAIQLDFTQAIAVHPGARAQPPHRDGEMWPVPPYEGEHLINLLFPLSRFTADNGATHVWARSHRGAEGMAADPIPALMQPGDVLAFLGSTLHGQGENRSSQERRALAVGYSAAWLRASENQALAYPPLVARLFPEEVRGLAGYRRIAPNLNNFDCRCPSELVSMSHAGAVDLLHPQQAAALEQRYGRLPTARDG